MLNSCNSPALVLHTYALCITLQCACSRITMQSAQSTGLHAGLQYRALLVLPTTTAPQARAGLPFCALLQWKDHQDLMRPVKCPHVCMCLCLYICMMHMRSRRLHSASERLACCSHVTLLMQLCRIKGQHSSMAQHVVRIMAQCISTWCCIASGSVSTGRCQVHGTSAATPAALANKRCYSQLSGGCFFSGACGTIDSTAPAMDLSWSVATLATLATLAPSEQLPKDAHVQSAACNTLQETESHALQSACAACWCPLGTALCRAFDEPTAYHPQAEQHPPALQAILLAFQMCGRLTAVMQGSRGTTCCGQKVSFRGWLTSARGA